MPDSSRKSVVKGGAPSRLEVLKVLDGLTTPVLVVSAEGLVLYANRAVDQYLDAGWRSLLGRPFPYALTVGPMEKLPLEMNLSPVHWSGEPAQMLILTSLEDKAEGGFQLEWRLETAEGAAREAEAKAARLEERLADARRELEEMNLAGGRVRELESLLRNAHGRIAGAEDQVRESVQKVQVLEQELAGASSRTDLEEELQRADLRLIELQNGLRQVRDEKSELESLRQAAEKRAEDAEDRLREAQELLGIYQNRIAALSRRQETSPPPVPDPDEAVEGNAALKDDLTGLVTQAVILRHLELAVKQTSRYGGRTALLYIDLDRFQVVNDAMGARVAEGLLKAVAKRLQSVVRGSDVLGRKGEDEFLILLTELKGQEEATAMASAVARRVYEMLAPPFSVQGQKLFISASVGISLSPGDARSSEQLQDHARAAMFLAKEMGRGRYQFFTPELQRQNETRLGLVDALRRALDLQQFRLVYQPIVQLKSGRVVGVEALLRWQHPERGLLEPEVFLDVAEETGLIVPIGRWVALQACEQSRRWHDEGLDIFTSINLSSRQVLQADLGPVFARTLEITGAKPGSIVAELSESTYNLDPNRVDPVLEGLREVGLELALDQFGSGASSLARLAAGHLSFLKVDRRFTQKMPADRKSTGIVLASLGLTRSLKLRPIAVGVENDQQKVLLRRLECELVQGNFLAPPLAAEQISRFAQRAHL